MRNLFFGKGKVEEPSILKEKFEKLQPGHSKKKLEVLGKKKFEKSRTLERTSLRNQGF